MQENYFPELDEVKRQTIENIAALIRAYCEEHNMTRQQFADAAGISVRVLHEILNQGSGYRTPNPTLETLQAVYRVLGVEGWLSYKNNLA